MNKSGKKDRYRIENTTISFEKRRGYIKRVQHPVSEHYLFGKPVEIGNEHTTTDPTTQAVIFTDRIKILNRVLAQCIDCKGMINCQTTWFFMNQVRHIVTPYATISPHQNILMGEYVRNLAINFIVRGYLGGKIFDYYSNSQNNREINGVQLPDQLNKFSKLPQPVVTPVLDAESFDYDLADSRNKVLASNTIALQLLQKLEDISLALYQYGAEYAKSQNLILLDTMFRFGFNNDGEIRLVGELLTGDTSRYLSTQEHSHRSGQKYNPPKYLHKLPLREFVAAQLPKTKLKNQAIRSYPQEFSQRVSDQYLQLYMRLNIPTELDFKFKANLYSEMIKAVNQQLIQQVEPSKSASALTCV